jgi:hypothetical protein
MHRGPVSKLLSALLFAALFISIAVPVYFYLQSQSSEPARKSPRFSASRSAGARHAIRGFRFDSHIDGRTTLSIRADRFTIQKKKLGFFKVGLLNEARLENAVIHVYAEIVPSQSSSREEKPRHAAAGRLSFQRAFSKDALPAWKTKRIAGLVIEPVEVMLHDAQSVRTRIAADKAVLRLKQRDLYFSGNVKVFSGAHVLATDRLSLDPHHGRLITHQPYRLQTAGRIREGPRLKTDILLTSFDKRNETQGYALNKRSHPKTHQGP